MFFRKQPIEKRLKKLAHQCQSAKVLCVMSAEFLSCPIAILSMPSLPPTVSALSLQYKNQYVILYKLALPLSVERSILHELSHICLGHVDGVKIDLWAVIAGKTIFTDQQERDAEKLANQLLAAITDVRVLLPHTDRVSARFESLVG